MLRTWIRIVDLPDFLIWASGSPPWRCPPCCWGPPACSAAPAPGWSASPSPPGHQLDPPEIILQSTECYYDLLHCTWLESMFVCCGIVVTDCDQMFQVQVQSQPGCSLLPLLWRTPVPSENYSYTLSCYSRTGFTIPASGQPCKHWQNQQEISGEDKF